MVTRTKHLESSSNPFDYLKKNFNAIIAIIIYNWVFQEESCKKWTNASSNLMMHLFAGFLTDKRVLAGLRGRRVFEFNQQVLTKINRIFWFSFFFLKKKKKCSNIKQIFNILNYLKF